MMVQVIDSNRTSIIHMSFPVSLRLYAQDCTVLYNNAALLKYLYHVRESCIFKGIDFVSFYDFSI